MAETTMSGTRKKISIYVKLIFQKERRPGWKEKTSIYLSRLQYFYTNKEPGDYPFEIPNLDHSDG